MATTCNVTLTTEGEYDLYSRTQQQILEYLPYFSAPVSAVGSAVIVYMILSQRRKSAIAISTYERIMLGMSSMDFISSFGITLFGHWAVPLCTPFVVGARGNQHTCNAAFYFLNFVFGSMFYSFFLAVYFLLLIRFNWPKARIARWMEPFAHITAAVGALCLPIYAHSRDLINPMYVLPGFCWPIKYPPDCDEKSDPDCVKSEGNTLHGIIFALAGAIIICMVLIVRQVRRTDDFVHRHAVGENNMPDKNKKIATEAMLFSAAFLIVFIPVVPFFFFHEDPPRKYRTLLFAFAFLAKLLTPLQGLFNAAIYLRKRFLLLHEEAEGGAMTLNMAVAYLNEVESRVNQRMSLDPVAVEQSCHDIAEAEQ